MTVSSTDHDHGAVAADQSPSRQFKKHKVLPRPRSDVAYGSPRRKMSPPELVVDYSPSEKSTSLFPSPGSFEHQMKSIGKGPDLPPTPPLQSRRSSGNQTATPSSSRTEETVVYTTPKSDIPLAPETPPEQRSPPTPDVTPPQPATRPAALRPTLTGRSTYRTATSESRTESFTTAREEPDSSDDEDTRSTIRPPGRFRSTSGDTIQQVQDGVGEKRTLKPQDIDAAFVRLNPLSENKNTSKTVSEFGISDKGRTQHMVPRDSENPSKASKSTKEAEALEARESRGVAVLDSLQALPTNATRLVRKPLLQNGNAQASPPRRVSGKKPDTIGPSVSDTSVAGGTKRLSRVSSKHSASTIVEAYLVDGPRPPQRQRTLRHVQKQRGLRDSIDASRSSTSEIVATDNGVRQGRPRTRREDGRHESYVSHTTTTSISSNRARHEVWKSGGIPVVVIPDRRSSSKSKSSREPSLRSTSSRRSQRTTSLGSAPLDMPALNGQRRGPSTERTRRRWTFSETDGHDQLTMDYPPAIPGRSSSLSAPTSRNTSRAPSMTSDSARTRAALQDVKRNDLELVQPMPGSKETQGLNSRIESAPQQRTLDPPITLEPLSPAQPSPATPQESQFAYDRLSASPHDDGQSLKSRRWTARNTPFSAASIDTTGTAPELSEAQEVHMYPHQNSSVLMVNHSAKPSDSSDATVKELAARGRPSITRTAPEGGEVPVTPPQPTFSLDDVDSPLRNPRAPPQPPSEPPALNFIPATPSGLTPAQERDVRAGNFFEMSSERPARRPSMVRRAFSRRRHSIDYPPTTTKAPGLLTRTFSLSRSSQRPRDTRDRYAPDMEERVTGRRSGAQPPEEDRLHPFWRPQWIEDEESQDCDCPECEEVYRYPFMDNRSPKPKRSLSARVRHTFAIFPVRNVEYPASDRVEGPERRTIRRTPSGYLRVMRRRSSMDSMRRRSRGDYTRPYTAPDDGRTPVWRRNNSRSRRSKESPRRFSIGSRFEGFQSIPRLLSERSREKRTRELRQKISGPREVRDGVGEVIRSETQRQAFQTNDWPRGTRG